MHVALREGDIDARFAQRALQGQMELVADRD
jgi:hypothetical protein